MEVSVLNGYKFQHSVSNITNINCTNCNESETDQFPGDYSNDSSIGMDENILRHSWHWTVVLIIAYAVVLILGLIGNIMVGCVWTLKPQMRTVTNLFILNLAVADLFVVLFCITPTLLSNIFVPWVLGSFMCKAVAYVQGVSVCASVYSLVAICLDRFLAIMFPMKMPRGLSTFQARVIILCIWIFAGTIILPWAIVFSVTVSKKGGQEYCVESWPESMDSGTYFLVANLLLCYALPLTLISVGNGLIWWHVARRKVPKESASPAAIKRVHRKTRQGVLKMLTAVTITFLVSWLPLYLIFLCLKFGGPQTESVENIMSIMMPFAQWLGASNSSCNPLLYAFLNKKFRDSFRSLMSCERFFENQRTTMSRYSTSNTATIYNQSAQDRRVTFRHPVIRL